jgi:hypothetical protein
MGDMESGVLMMELWGESGKSSTSSPSSGTLKLEAGVVAVLIDVVSEAGE